MASPTVALCVNGESSRPLQATLTMRSYHSLSMKTLVRPWPEWPDRFPWPCIVDGIGLSLENSRALCVDSLISGPPLPAVFCSCCGRKSFFHGCVESWDRRPGNMANV